MKKILWVLLCLPLSSLAQHFHITAFGGFSGYQGDLQSKRFTLEQSRLAFGLGLKYDLTPRLAIRAGLSHGKVEGSDQKNQASLRPRNLSFESAITEGSLMVEYALFNLDEKPFTPYVFAGVAVYHFNPYAYDTLGNKIFLRPLSTEGQGLAAYPDSKPYRLTQFAIPFGAGVRYAVSNTVSLGYELGMRKLFTDHLDDVSGRYADQFLLAQAKGAKAVEMAFRAGEVKNSNAVYPAAGELRGGPKFKDWYYFHGLSLTIRLNSSGTARSGRGGLDCPRVL